MDNHPISYNDLIDYLLGVLDSETQAHVAKHVSHCDECSATTVRFTAIRSLLREDDSLEPPPRVVARAKALYSQHRSPRRTFPFRLNFPSRISAFATGFALAIALFIGLSLFIANQDLPPDSALYPIKVTVQGLQIIVSNAGQYFGVSARPNVTLVPASTEFTLKQSVPAGIVISQIYGGGGNTGAIYTHDFVELFNRGNTTVSLAGWSLQYTSATGTSNFGAGATQITELPDVSLAPGQYFLIQEARGNGGTTPLPTPDLIDPTPITLSSTDGKVALVNTTKPLGCNGGTNPCVPNALASLIDLVGYGKADFFEGIGPTSECSNTTAVIRVNNGCTDTHNNLDDFSVGAPNPRNTAAPRTFCPSTK